MQPVAHLGGDCILARPYNHLHLNFQRLDDITSNLASGRE